MDGLLEKASQNIRKRMNLDLRDSPDDTSQRMLNAIQLGSFIDIHRHPETSETVVLLRGAVTELFYNDRGVEIARYELSIATGNAGLQIPAGTWHTLIPREPSVIMEVKNGRYKSLPETDILARE